MVITKTAQSFERGGQLSLSSICQKATKSHFMNKCSVPLLIKSPALPATTDQCPISLQMFGLEQTFTQQIYQQQQKVQIFGRFVYQAHAERGPILFNWGPENVHFWENAFEGPTY